MSAAWTCISLISIDVVLLDWWEGLHFSASNVHLKVLLGQLKVLRTALLLCKLSGDDTLSHVTEAGKAGP